MGQIAILTSYDQPHPNNIRTIKAYQKAGYTTFELLLEKLKPIL